MKYKCFYCGLINYTSLCPRCGHVTKEKKVNIIIIPLLKELDKLDKQLRKEFAEMKNDENE